VRPPNFRSTIPNRFKKESTNICAVHNVCASRYNFGFRVYWPMPEVDKEAPHTDVAGLSLGRGNHLRALRAFLRPFAFGEGLAPAIRKSSGFFPVLIAAVSHRGFNPRPAHVSLGFSGLRYLGATEPRAPPRPADFARPAPPWKRVSFESSDSSDRR
jgi:hypothetical protein